MSSPHIILLLKTHVDGYTRKDGTYVAPHEDRRTRKPNDIKQGKSSPADNRAFRAWFKDSKVVDNDGRPLVVYHGTPNGGFSDFSDNLKGTRTGHAAGDVGFHFTDSPEHAEAYSEGYKLQGIETYRKKFGKEPDGIAMPAGASVYPVYLSLQNPLRVPTSKLINSHLIESAKSRGHDGIIADMGGAAEYVVFKPEQIKSATGNSGSFDMGNADMTKALVFIRAR